MTLSHEASVELPPASEFRTRLAPPRQDAARVAPPLRRFRAPAGTSAPAPAATNGSNSGAGSTRARRRGGRGEAGEARAIMEKQLRLSDPSPSNRHHTYHRVRGSRLGAFCKPTGSRRRRAQFEYASTRKFVCRSGA